MTVLDLVYIPVAAAFLPRLLNKRRGGWGERFGDGETWPRTAKPRVLLHAVSVGEVNALRALVPLLTPHCEVVVSATTDTGVERANALYASIAHVTRFPLDTSAAVRRFLVRLQPDAVALTELELWPQFMRACRARKVPVVVINGRLSQRSYGGYRKIRFFMKEFFSSLAFAAVQDQEYASRFIAMGTPSERCQITGSMKWDAITLVPPGQIDPAALQLAESLGIDRTRPLVVAGSTGPGEEQLLHQAVPADVQLLCAPRKLERAAQAAAAMPGCIARSSRRAAPAGTNRYLLDTIGELRLAYMLADVVVVGRSFFDLFGSDPIEPIALGKPVIIGPAVSDFATIVEQFKVRGGLMQVGKEGLAEAVRDLLADSSQRASVVNAGIEVIRKQQGASRRHAEMILGLISGQASQRAATLLRENPA